MKRKIHITVTALFLALIFCFGTAFWLLPDTEFSPEENRELQAFPTINAEGWLDGKISSGLIDYFSDQFPLRNLWLDLHARGELLLGKGEVNGVLVGKNGQLAVRRFHAYVSRLERLEDTDHYSAEHVQRGLTALSELNQTLSEKQIPLCVLLPPRTIDVTIHDFSYPSDLSDSLDETIRTTLEQADVNSVELLATFREMHDGGEYVYYRTDHHWTTKGAYTAYCAVMRSWGMEGEILPESYFTVRQIPNFYGTTHARAGLSSIPPDTLEIWGAPDDSSFTVFTRKGDGIETILETGFISEKYLSEKDKYSAFLDGTHDMLFIMNQDAANRGESRPRLLLAKDSFANSMVPFLARHFDILLVNLTGSTDHSDLTALCTEYGCSRVLVVCNRENLITSNCLTLLR